MKYKAFTLTVKWENQTTKKYYFHHLKNALKAAWEVRDSPTIKYITLKTEWRETTEWVQEIAMAGSVSN